MSTVLNKTFTYEEGHTTYLRNKLHKKLPELTEGRATGIPTILKELQKNASPAPRFISDDDRIFFEVELFIHPAFEEKAPYSFEVNELKRTLDGMDALLEKLLDFGEINHDELTAGAIAGIQAGTVDESIHIIDNQSDKLIGAINSTQAGTIAGAIADAIADKENTILTLALNPQDRQTLLTKIGVSNHRKNYERYMLPLVHKG